LRQEIQFFRSLSTTKTSCIIQFFDRVLVRHCEKSAFGGTTKQSLPVFIVIPTKVGIRKEKNWIPPHQVRGRLCQARNDKNKIASLRSQDSVFIKNVDNQRDYLDYRKANGICLYSSLFVTGFYGKYTNKI
jgi:hypothetical protein